MSGLHTEVAYDGVAGSEIARQLEVPEVVLYDEVSSTMDMAHRRAEGGALAGTVVLADRQTAGRGQHGRVWSSQAGAGVWLSVIERMTDTAAIEVLSLRVGLYLAEVLDSLAGATVQVKRPNDLYLEAGKLGGILCEARWHGTAPAWVVIGLGVNTRRPDDVADAVALPQGVSRLEVLRAVAPAIRRAAGAAGRLSAGEVRQLESRELRKPVP